jgi:DNA-binding LacI/PurR family transcriptional regulator
VAGQRRPTLEDVAARAGVSRSLASIAIRGESGVSEPTRERVLRAADEIGYRPDTRARLLAQGRAKLLGVTFNVQHAFHAELIDAIYAAAEPAAYDVFLSAVTPGRDESRALEALLGYRCEALVLLGPDSPESRLAELGRRLPAVVVGREVTDPSLDVVRTADDVGMRLAVDHLVSLGHRDIVHIDGGRGHKAAARRRGYRTAMRRHGLTNQVRVIPGGQTGESGAVAARVMLAERAMPTAVLAYDDDCACGLLDALIRSGVSVPDDVSVVGYDDSRISRLPYVSLTTIGQDARQMASLALNRAHARLVGDEVTEREIVLSPHLVERDTTARARSKGDMAMPDPANQSTTGARRPTGSPDLYRSNTRLSG